MSLYSPYINVSNGDLMQTFLVMQAHRMKFIVSLAFFVVHVLCDNYSGLGTDMDLVEHFEDKRKRSQKGDCTIKIARGNQPLNSSMFVAAVVWRNRKVSIYLELATPFYVNNIVTMNNMLQSKPTEWR